MVHLGGTLHGPDRRFSLPLPHCTCCTHSDLLISGHAGMRILHSLVQQSNVGPTTTYLPTWPATFFWRRYSLFWGATRYGDMPSTPVERSSTCCPAPTSPLPTAHLLPFYRRATVQPVHLPARPAPLPPSSTRSPAYTRVYTTAFHTTVYPHTPVLRTQHTCLPLRAYRSATHALRFGLR